MLISAVNLNAKRQDLVALECIVVLGSHWLDSVDLVSKVRGGHPWARDVEIWSAMDQLHESGHVESQQVERLTGPDHPDKSPTVTVTQWRLT